MDSMLHQDKRERTDWLAKYDEGEALLYPKPFNPRPGLPTWVIVGRRCQDLHGAYGRCQAAGERGTRYCYFHTKIRDGLIDRPHV